MRRRVMLSTLVMLLALPAAVLPVTAGAASEPDFVAFHAWGASAVDQHRDGSFGFTVDLFSLTTGERIGSLTDRARCGLPSVPPCTVMDITTTYRLPGGEVISRARWSVMGDPARPGFVLVGSRGTGPTVLSATGGYAGRTGRVAGWGRADLRRFPHRIAVDLFGVLRFDPTDAAVVGSTELFSGDAGTGLEASGAMSQYFLGDGANRSTSPGQMRTTTPLYGLVDGQKTATATATATCSEGPPPCAVLEVLSVFDFPDGTVRARSRIPVTHDPQRPGFGLIGARPASANILVGTGAYARRTGRLLVSGSIDLRNVPVRAPVEGISVLLYE